MRPPPLRNCPRHGASYTKLASTLSLMSFILRQKDPRLNKGESIASNIEWVRFGLDLSGDLRGDGLAAIQFIDCVADATYVSPDNCIRAQDGVEVEYAVRC